MSDSKTKAVDRAASDLRPRIIPADLGRAHRPFATAAASARKCYVIFDAGPPKVMTEVDCGDIVIVDAQAAFDDSGELTMT